MTSLVKDRSATEGGIDGLLTLGEAAAHVASPVLCLGCGEEIPEKRLKAVAKATRCVRCQAPYDEYVTPPDSAMAVDNSGDAFAEFADSLRSS